MTLEEIMNEVVKENENSSQADRVAIFDKIYAIPNYDEFVVFVTPNPVLRGVFMKRCVELQERTPNFKAVCIAVLSKRLNIALNEFVAANGGIESYQEN